jgi:hypothetical protein
VYALIQAGGRILAGTGSGLVISDDGETWRRVTTGYSVGMTALLAIAPRGARGQATGGAHDLAGWTLYAGTAQGVLRSTTGGESWQLLDSGMAAPYVFGLLAAPGEGGQQVWAATAAGLFRLREGATNWTLVLGGWPRDAAALSLARAADGTLLAGTDVGLYRSIDGGEQWQATAREG